MSVKERDPLTGHQTTGHEWDGITELNTRVPRAVWFSIGVTHVWALPSGSCCRPGRSSPIYTRGLLGTDQREQVEASGRRRRARRAPAGPTSIAAASRRPRSAPTRRSWRWWPAPAPRSSATTAPPATASTAPAARASRAWSTTPGSGAAMTRRCWRRCGSGSTPRIPTPGSRRCWPSAATASSTRDEVRSVAAYVQSLVGAGDGRRRGPRRRRRHLRRQLRLLPRRGGPRHDRARRARPDRRVLDLRRRRARASSPPSTAAGRGWMPAWEDRLSLADRKILAVYVLGLRSRRCRRRRMASGAARAASASPRSPRRSWCSRPSPPRTPTSLQVSFASQPDCVPHLKKPAMAAPAPCQRRRVRLPDDPHAAGVRNPQGRPAAAAREPARRGTCRGARPSSGCGQGGRTCGPTRLPSLLYGLGVFLVSLVVVGSCSASSSTTSCSRP